MKKIKSIIGIFVMALFIAMIPAAVTQAKELTSVPKKIRVYTGESPTTINLKLRNGALIESVKSGNSKLYAKLTYTSYNKEDGSVTNNQNEVSFYSAKNGTYDVTFKLSDKTSVKAKVFCYANPLKIKVNGKESTMGYTTSSKAKVNISFAKGNTRKKLEYSKEVKTKNGNSVNTSRKYKTFTNGQKITLNNQPSYYESSYKSEYSDYESRSLHNPLLAYTYVRVTYKDKYTQQNEEYERMIAMKLVK